MVTRFEIGTRRDRSDARGREVVERVRTHLGIPIERVRTVDVYRLDARLEPGEAERVLSELVDPVLQRGAIDRLDPRSEEAFDFVVHAGYKPGVTDPVGKSALVAVGDTLGRDLGPDAAVYGSRLYLLTGVDRNEASRIAVELLANPVIQTVEVVSHDEYLGSPPDRSVPKVAARERPAVRPMVLDGDDDELERISRAGLLALSLDEMRAIRDHFRAEAAARRADGLGPHPTDVELECLAQTWSEHCKHKIFNAEITYGEPGRQPETIRSLFSSYIKRATREIDETLRRRNGNSWLISVFHDNAGVIAFDDSRHLVFKVETHNSPSALDPYGGAITGIVGVNRDPFGTGLGADLLVNVWGYCFASPFHDGPVPDGLLHPRRVRDGVHQGVIDGGNQSGVPYGRGWELFDERFLGKPLVFCGTVGSLPVEIAGGPGERKGARAGDRIVMTGGRIGADGIHGATFSSAALDETAPVQAVQIGDPITQKRMFDFLIEARALGLYSSITDNGAGGLSSSVGEMAQAPGGARVDLARAPLKYEGLAPWEILVSEAQERMTLAVAPERVDELLDLARRREVEATDLGEFTDDGMFHVTYGDETVARLSMAFLHDGDPAMRLEARWEPPRFTEPERPAAATLDLEATLVALLGRPNLGSGEAKARHYDHEVKGLTVVPPFVGARSDIPADATVFLAHHGSTRGFVLSEAVNPFYSDIDTEAMAAACVDLAVRRQVCAGARLDRIALLDNFCWPDPVVSPATPDGRYKLAQLVRACRGLYDSVTAYGTPLVSGKDSMKNDAVMDGVKISVPPTLLVSAIGLIDDVRQSLTLEPIAAGDRIFLLGETRDETGASEYYRFLGSIGNRVPRVDPQRTLPLYRALSTARDAGLLRSATAPALGGWGVALARCAMAGEFGLDVDFDAAPDLAALEPDVALFSESCGRLLVTVADEDAAALLKALAGQPCREIGRVVDDNRLRVRHGGKLRVDADVETLRSAFKEALADA